MLKARESLAVGPDAGSEITTTRHGMWSTVASRKHSVPKIFPFGSNPDEFMLYGTVALGLKNGTETELEWAGRAHVVKSSTDGKWRMNYYQIYLVSSSFLFIYLFFFTLPS